MKWADIRLYAPQRIISALIVMKILKQGSVFKDSLHFNPFTYEWGLFGLFILSGYSRRIARRGTCQTG